MDQPGFYGKVPAHGDFIDRQLPVGFIREWDSWLQQCVANSRERLGDSWLDLYLTSPIWRFTISEGALNEHAWAGILLPSVDSVGRYFPLTIAQQLPTQTALARFHSQNESWFQNLERIALGALQEGLDAEQISAELKTDSLMHSIRPNGLERSHAVQADHLESAFASQLENLVQQQYQSYSFWLCAYQEPSQQNCLMAEGLPTPDQFTALLDGQYPQWSWGNENSLSQR